MGKVVPLSGPAARRLCELAVLADLYQARGDE